MLALPLHGAGRLVAYDPSAHGALCDQCFLRDKREGDPVPPEWHQGAGAIIVAEAPGETEVQHGRPLCGASGTETMAALEVQGLSRNHFHWTQAVVCRPPSNDMDLLLHKMQRENAERKKANGQRGQEGALPLYPTPQQCCRPRLIKELEAATYQLQGADGSPARQINVIAMGKYAWNSIAQAGDSIGSVRGGPAEGWLDKNGAWWKTKWPALDARDATFLPVHLRVMPVHHAAFVLRSPKWRPAFRGDFGRAFRWWRGALSWKVPQIHFNPDPAQLRAFLGRGEAYFGVDFETDSKEPLTAQIRCLGICTASGDEAVVVHFLGIDGQTHFYPEEQQAEVEEICKEFLASERVRKVGHNFNYYDRLVAEARWGIRPQNVIDTILGARLADSEMPKSLAYVASVYTDAPSWKKDKKALTAQTDEELGTYCVGDVAGDVRSLPGMAQAVERNGQMHLWNFFAKNQAVAAGMHRVGMFVDEAKRQEWDRKLAEEARVWLRRCQVLSSVPSLNPNSTPQLRDLLFNRWALPAEDFTKLGDPSTGDEVLRKMLKEHSGLNREQKWLVKSIRKFRRASKSRGTFILPLRPSSELAGWDPLAFNDDELAEEVETIDGKPLDWDARSEIERDKDRKKEKKPGLTLPDGRVHPNFSAHVTTSMRYNSSGPNAQNFIKKLRNVIRAAPGHVLVGADQGQLELRVAAALWNCEPYLEAFQKGGDPHLVTCYMVYGESYFNSLGPTAREMLRAFAKRFSYAVLYGASLETVHDTLTSSENPATGHLLFPDLSIRETRKSMKAWLGANPAIVRGWEGEVAFFRQHGYLEEPVVGHRRFFRDGEDRNELLNFRCQSAGSAIVHLATHRLIEEFIPFEKWGPGTGLIQQGHDSLVVECPENQADYVVKALNVCMSQPVKAFPGVPFVGDARVAMTWDKV
jgi:DNA polymerase I-like protein with 3'-5' exonuclease and polymerase domains/uracil-DNA glycosylase